MLDDHGERPYAIVNLDIRFDHSCILKSQRIVNVHITGKLDLRVPKFDYRDFGVRDAYYPLHPICNAVSHDFVQHAQGTDVQIELQPEDRSSQEPCLVW